MLGSAHDMELPFIFLGNVELFSDGAKLVYSWKSGSLQFPEFITHWKAVRGSHKMSIVACVTFSVKSWHQQVQVLGKVHPEGLRPNRFLVSF